MTTPPSPDAIAAARNLTTELRGLREDLQAVRQAAEERDEAVAAASRERDEVLRKYGRRNRRLVLADIIATVIAIVSTVIALHANSSASQAQRRADRAYARIVAAHESQISGCETGNQLRREQVGFWEFLATLSLKSPAPHLTAKQIARNRREVAVILTHSRKSFPQLNCQRIYRLP